MKQSTVKEFCVSDYRRTIKLEYRIYFALIFLISIPLILKQKQMRVFLEGHGDMHK